MRTALLRQFKWRESGTLDPYTTVEAGFIGQGVRGPRPEPMTVKMSLDGYEHPVRDLLSFSVPIMTGTKAPHFTELLTAPDTDPPSILTSRGRIESAQLDFTPNTTVDVSTRRVYIDTEIRAQIEVLSLAQYGDLKALQGAGGVVYALKRADGTSLLLRSIRAHVYFNPEVRTDGFQNVLLTLTGVRRDVFDQLKERGLTGVQVVTSDGHQGLREAARSRFPGCIWVRCHAHFRRQVLDETPANHREAMQALLDEVLEASSPLEARRTFEEILDGGVSLRDHFLVPGRD